MGNLIEGNNSNLIKIIYKDIILSGEIRSEPRDGCSLSPFLAIAVRQVKEGKELILEKDNVTSLWWNKTKVV